MKNIILILSIVLFVLSGMIACKESASSKMSDSEITSAVQEKLRSDVNVGSSDIQVETNEGKVTLTGEVDSLVDSNQAIALAKSIPQVKSVQSELEVKEVLTNEDVSERIEEKEDKAMKDAEQATDGSVANAVSDAAITANIKMKFTEDPVVSALKINVDTNDGRVTLTGTVKSEAEAKRAIQIAESVDGVSQVASVLTVKS